MGRDPRRVFSWRQRLSLLRRSRFRCSRCGASVMDATLEAHHVRHHADGGETELHNGMVLCHTCHEREHEVFELRDWQNRGFERVKDLDKSIVEACTGSGKSAFSGQLAKHWLDTGVCDHVIAVAPSTAIKFGIMKQWNANFGIVPRSRLVSQSARAFQIPRAFDASVITYQEFRNKLVEEILAQWKSHGFRVGIVFDEIHHAATDKVWGAQAGRIGHDIATRVCIMTGTPFRSDGQPIELMEYVVKNGEKVAEPHFRYTYRQAVEDDVCRPVTCRWIEGELTMSHRNIGVYSRKSHKVVAWEMSAAKKMILDPTGEAMTGMIRQVHKDLMNTRERYPDAAALFVCRPGIDESQLKHVHAIEKRIQSLTGETPVVVTHDDDDSADNIDAFAKSSSPYIVAVNMISEGVDIPRLRLVAFCRYTDSEMLFRQIAGRVVRKTIDRDPVGARLYVPDLPPMKEYGERLWDEAELGCKDKRYVFRDDDDIGHVGNGESLVREPNVVGVDCEAGAGAGHFDQSAVGTDWVTLAERSLSMHPSHKHLDQVQVGFILKSSASINESDKRGFADEVQQKSNKCSRINRLVGRLASYKHDNNIGLTWVKEVFEPYNVNSLEDIRVLWDHSKIDALIRNLVAEIDSAAFERQS